jgi:hypothetical protein
MREDMKLPGILLNNSRSQWCLQIFGIHMLVRVVRMVALGVTQSRKTPSAKNEAFLYIYNGSLRDCHTLNSSTLHFLSVARTRGVAFVHATNSLHPGGRITKLI